MEHSFDVECAARLGILEAIIIRHFQYWILKNKSNGSNVHDGRTWTYNSVSAFADYFTYVSAKQVRSALDHLVKEGIILKGNFNMAGYDRTCWYAFRDESTYLKRQINLPKRATPFAPTGKPIPDTKPDTKPNNTPPTPKGEALPFADDKFRVAWDMWKKYKAEKKKTLTPTTIKLQFKLLKSTDVTSAIRIIERSITHGWAGLFLLDKKPETKNFKY